MAASLQIRGGSLSQVGGVIRHFKEIWSNLQDPAKALIAATGSRKHVHSSVYQKNEDEVVHPNRVPEDVIQAKSQKWWVPHPKTGVFGPEEEQSWAGGDHHHSHERTGESVLEQQAWFRPLEDVQKQPSN